MIRGTVIALGLFTQATPVLADGESDALVPYLRAGMIAEAVIPDTGVEVGINDKRTGVTLSWPMLLRLGATDFGHHTSPKHAFVLAVAEPQLALGRQRAYRFRGLASLRVGGGLYNQNLSTYLEAGYHHSQLSPESGPVVGVGVGYLPHHLVSVGLLTRYYAGDDERVSMTLDLSVPLQLWNP